MNLYVAEMSMIRIVFCLRCGARGIPGVMCIPFNGHNSSRSQFEDVEPAISHQTEIGRRRNSQAVIEERRVFDRRAVVALGAEVEHDSARRRDKRL